MFCSPSVTVVPPLASSLGAGQSVLSVPASSGLAGILVPQVGQNFNSQTTRAAAAILGIGAIAPLPGSQLGNAVQGPDGEIRLGPFDATPSLPPPNTAGNTERPGDGSGIGSQNPGSGVGTGPPVPPSQGPAMSPQPGTNSITSMLTSGMPLPYGLLGP